MPEVFQFKKANQGMAAEQEWLLAGEERLF